jgi:ATP-dependent exoDNAse (exonuclease V) beta subunit
MAELLHLALGEAAGRPELWERALQDDVSDAAELERWKARLMDEIAGLPLATKKDGTPRASWETARGKLLRALAEERWEEVLSKGILAAVAKDPTDPRFDRAELDADWIRMAHEAQRLGRAALVPALRRKLGALRVLSGQLGTAFEAVQARLGVLRFEDVTRMLGQPDLLTEASELHYRLDQEVQHILLDEFQDTSRVQWRALEPLVSELLAGDEGMRAAVLVADPKQSIYGWRKASPELVHHVARAHGLASESLTQSWRSSPIVLELVRDVFTDIASNPVMASLPAGPEVARDWLTDFTEMTAAKPDLPGLVCVHQSRETSRGNPGIEPAILRDAARTIEKIHREASGHSLGVLVRTNKTVGYLIAELKALGVPVSGEGGAPLTDTVPVLALLSLLRMADHPRDRVARYHVARTPVGALVGLTTLNDDAAARRVSAEVRKRLVEVGYGAALADWVEALAPSCDAREAARLKQLVELGHRWDPRATLRPIDFVRHVEATVVEDPSSAPVRVMTVHKSKGLEFDIVAIPDLYQNLSPRRRTLVVARPEATGHGVEALYPSIASELEPFFPEIAEAKAASQAPDVRDSLSLLYVALTRAKQALHLFLPRDGGGERSAARLIATALDIDLAGEVRAGCYAVRGETAWFAVGREGPPEPRVALEAEHMAGREPPLLRPAPPQPRRNLPRRSPSDHQGELEGGSAGGDAGVDLALRLYLPGREARDRGTLVHAWCEAIPWIDDGIPEDAALLALGRERVPDMPAEAMSALLATFTSWVSAPEIEGALAKARYRQRHPDAELVVEVEYPFLHLAGGALQEGFVDRLVLVRAEGRVVAAEVLDFKTDRIAGSSPEDTARALSERTERYRGQIEAYCAMIQARFGLSSGDVRGTLLFLEAGVEVSVV